MAQYECRHTFLIFLFNQLHLFVKRILATRQLKLFYIVKNIVNTSDGCENQ